MWYNENIRDAPHRRSVPIWTTYKKLTVWVRTGRSAHVYRAIAQKIAESRITSTTQSVKRMTFFQSICIIPPPKREWTDRRFKCEAT